MIANSPTESVLFDLDGTLVDSIPGIEHSVRTAVTSVMPGVQVPPLREFIGPPVRTVMERAIPEATPAQLDELEKAFRASYDMDGWRMTRCYDGVPETIQELARRGVRCFVVTNKPAAPARQILDELQLSPYMVAAVSPDSATPRFASKTATTLHVLERYAIAPELAVFVGDGRDDAEAAAHCGLRFAAVAYGFGEVHRVPGVVSCGVLQVCTDLLPLIASGMGAK